MSTNSAPSAEKISPGKRWIFRGLTIALILLVGSYATEMILRWQQARIDRSDQLAPGMVQYDADLGWSLLPGWTGTHRHADFDAAYTVNALGFRNDAPVLVRIPGNRLTMVVGDSFTFGLGVNDDATFVHHLNATRPDGVSFSNGAVPGYSTDQEALLIAQRILRLQPDRIVLMIYLGNDHFDNLRPFPLQVSSAKPYFEVTAAGLVLRNHPVPKVGKPRGSGPDGLVTALWGDDPAQWPRRTRLELQSELFRRLGPLLLPAPDYQAGFSARFAPALQLMERILDRVAADCARQNVRLVVVPLAGRSFIHAPDSASAQYQEFFRRHLVEYAAGQPWTVIDLADRMRSRYQQKPADWYYPNDGHLTPDGHRLVAEILQAELKSPRE